MGDGRDEVHGQSIPALSEPVAPDAARTDADILTIRALHERLPECCLMYGYAVEAFCGGKVTRAHSDIDLQCAGQKGLILEAAQKSLKGWYSLPERHPYRMEFACEDFDPPRLVTVKVVPGLVTEGGALIDSAGWPHAVRLPEFYPFVATRIWMYNNPAMPPNCSSRIREFGWQDAYDVKRLISLPRCEPDRVVAALAQRFMIWDKLDHDRALLRAHGEYAKARLLIEKPAPPSIFKLFL